MTETWTDMARTALAAGRRWRGLAHSRSLDEARLGFGFADVLVLSLVLDLQGARQLACGVHGLSAPLREVFGGGGRTVVETDAGLRGGVVLQALGDATAGENLHVVHGLRGGIELGAAGASAGTRLRPLAGIAPAFWQCGLALVVRDGEGTRTDALCENLARSMRGEWIDPLALYERVQVLTARLKAHGEGEELDEEGRVDRIAALEKELASLKRSALVTQHLMLADAVERARAER